MRSEKIKRMFIIIAIVVLLLFICLPAIVFYTITHQPWKLVAGLLFIISLFLLPLLLFRKHLKLYAWLLAIFGFFSLLATIPVFYFGIPLNTEIMQLIYNTSYAEASELFDGYLWQIGMAIIVYWLIVIFIIKIIPHRISKTVSLIMTLICITIILITPIFSFGFRNYSINFRNTLFRYYPFYIEYYGKQFYEEIKLADKHPQLVKNFHFYPEQKNKPSVRQIYVLFIGESSRYNHWGINGYSRNTSPLLDKEANLISFKNVCTAGGMTELSVPLMLTQAKPKNYSKHINEKSVIALFNEAGFHTYWISDQVDGINVMMHAKEADSLILLQSGYNSTIHVHYGMELMDDLKNVLKDDKNNLFIVIHTLGSHFAYNYRYPESFDRFRPSDGKFVLQPNKKTLKQIYINEYDNSILYDNAVIDSAIHLIKNENTVSFLYYLSDHGENLYDDNRNLFQHEPVKPSTYIAHIPLFIWTSDSFNKFFPHKIHALRSHVGSRISSDNTFNTIANMADLQFPSQDTTQSFANMAFKDTVRIILGGDHKLYRYKELVYRER